MSWELVFSKQARKDAVKIDRAGLRKQTIRLLKILAKNPFQNPPPYEKLLGHYSGTCSRRINIYHRLIYQVVEETRKVKILRMWTHYS